MSEVPTIIASTTVSDLPNSTVTPTTNSSTCLPDDKLQNCSLTDTCKDEDRSCPASAGTATGVVVTMTDQAPGTVVDIAEGGSEGITKVAVAAGDVAEGGATGPSNSFPGDVALKSVPSATSAESTSSATAAEGSSSSARNSRRFFCREWAWAKLWACVEQRPAAKTCGALLVAGPGAGKTALCQELVSPTAGHGRHASQLQARLLAHHFCHAHDVLSLCVANFVQSLVTQLSYSPLIPGYRAKLETNDIRASLDMQFLYHNPDEAFKKAVLYPLSEIENPQKTLLIVIDSVDEDSLTNASENGNELLGSISSSKQSNVSRTVADLLASHHHLLPHWILLVVSARRCSRFITRQFTGFRRIALDDLRRNQVVRDVQQYILCRLDREPALRNHLSRETAEMLNQLHIKSNGCFLYLEKVLDGVAEGWVTLREIRDIPGTLNGLYLWLCQRLYPRRNFQRVAPLLAVTLSARQALTPQELQDAIRTRAPDMSDEEWTKRWGLLRRVLCPYSEKVLLFHHSFAEWLLDVKHCTQKYLVDVSQGHAMLAMLLTVKALTLNPAKVQEFAFHLARMPILAPLQHCHLAQWLVSSGASVDTCFEHVGPLDQKALKLLLEAGAELPSDPLYDEEPEEDDEEDEEEEEEDEEQDINEEVYVEEISAVKYVELKPDEGGFEETQKLDMSIHQEELESNLNDIFTNNMQLVDNETSLLLSKSDIVHNSELTTEDLTGGSLQHPSNNESNNLMNSRPRSSSNEIMCSLSELQTSVESSLISSSRGTSGGRLSTNSSAASSSHHRRSGGVGPSGGGRRVGEQRRRRQKEDPLYPYLRGGPVDQRDAAGRTLLHTAAHQGDASLVQLLLEAQALHSLQDCGGQTPLHLAARQGHAEVVATLLSHGADPDLADGDGWTALRSAAWGGHADVVSVLLQGRAQVWQRSSVSKSK